MEIPLQAQIECQDGIFGQAVYMLINPIVDQVTHLVVRATSSNTEYLIPVVLMSGAVANTIQLRCSKTELEQMELFAEMEFIEDRLFAKNIREGAGMYGMVMECADLDQVNSCPFLLLK
jgi:hypothetical protein